MISGLGRFVRALRREGVDASPAELLDATRAVEHVGVEDRTRFQSALRMTLAKGARQREVFDRLFDRYFAPPRGKRSGRRADRKGAAGSSGGRSGSGAGETAGGRADAQAPRPRSHGRRPHVPRVDRQPQAAQVREAIAAARLGGRRP